MWEVWKRREIILGRDDERQKWELYRRKVKGEKLKKVGERLSTTGSLPTFA